MSSLSEKHCVPCEGGAAKLTVDEAHARLETLNAWEANPDYTIICKKFTFPNFYHTMAFVNAIAWVAHKEKHHPDITCGYNYCIVCYTTHALSGLSENDFICAAKVDQLGNS